MIRALKRLWLIRRALFSERMFVVWETETEYHQVMSPREMTVKEVASYREVCDSIFSGVLNVHDANKLINEPREK